LATSSTIGKLRASSSLEFQLGIEIDMVCIIEFF
jgi:hypothetical protein